MKECNKELDHTRCARIHTPGQRVSYVTVGNRHKGQEFNAIHTLLRFVYTVFSYCTGSVP